MPGITTGATVVADTAVVVVAGAVVVGAIEAAAEQPPARAVPSVPQYHGMPEPSGQVPPKYPANEPDARATVVVVVVELVVVVVVVVVVEDSASVVVVVVAEKVLVAGFVVTVFVEPVPVGIKLIISTTPFLTPESTFLATP